MHLSRAGNRHDPRLLRQQPRERNLRGRRILPSSNMAEQIDQRLIGLHRLWGETRKPASDVGFVEGGGGINLACEEALPSGLHGTNPISSSSQAGNTSASGSRAQREYSLLSEAAATCLM